MSLFKFQHEDVNNFWWKKLSGRGIFEWECGTGKTFVGARICQVFKDRGMSVVVVVKKTLHKDWIDNCKERGVELSSKKEGQFFLTTYGRVKHVKNEYDLVIVDEAHHIKSPTSNQSKEMRKLANRTKYFLAMTGTLSNYRDSIDYLNYLWCINTDEVKKYLPDKISHFRREYQDYKTKPFSKMGYYQTNKRGVQVLNYLMKKYTTKRKLRDENEIPEYREVFKYVNSEFKLKDKIKELQDQLPDLNIDATYEKLHVNHALLMANGIDFETKEMRNTAKFDVILDVLDDIGDDYCIIWVYWRTFGIELQKYLKKKKIDSYLINGDTSTKKRDEYVEGFKAKKKMVLIASTGSLAEGKNLQFCCYDIVANQYYDIIKDTQGRARIERNGQTRRMVRTRIVAKSKIEKAVCSVLKAKMNFQEADDYMKNILSEEINKIKK